MENKKFCTICGNEFKSTDRFCSKCGKKNDNYIESDISSDGAVTVDTTKDKKIYKKPNTKLIIACVAVVVLLMVGFISTKVFALLSPNSFVSKAVFNTFENINKQDDMFNDVPSISSILANSEDNIEKELFLKIEDVNMQSIGITNSISSVLNGYGINFNMQTDKDKIKNNIALSLMDGESEFISGNIYIDDKLISLEVPKLYDGILGLKIDKTQDENNKDLDDSSEEFASIRKVTDFLLNAANQSEEIRKISEEKSTVMLKKLAKLTDFKKDKNNKMLYSTTINGNQLVLLFKNYIVDLASEEEVKQYIVDYMYIVEGEYTRDYYVDMVDNMILALPDEIDYMLEDVEIGDLSLNIIIDNKCMKNLNADISVKSDDQNYDFKYIMNYIENKDTKSIDCELKLGSGQFESIKGCIKYYKEGNENNKEYSLEFIPSVEDSTISFNFKEILKKDRNYESSLNYNVSQDNINVAMKCEAIGSYKDKERMDYSNIGLSFGINEQEIRLDLSGYVSESKIKEVKSVDTTKIKYIEELDKQELKQVINEIDKKLDLLINDFGESI